MPAARRRLNIMDKNISPSALSLTRAELAGLVARLGGQAFRAKQIWQWQYKDLATGWEAMSNLPAALRANLAEAAADSEHTARVVAKDGERGGTMKLLLKLADGGTVETVLIPSQGRHTVCVSSQIGCAFRCAFCASGTEGLARSLDAGEIVAQVILAAREIGSRPDNVVFMGIGEPFANYDAALKAARLMNDPEGLGIGARKITFSTCGVTPGISRFAEEPEQFELSVSLHAPNQMLREKLMPVAAGKWGLDELMKTCRDYTAKTNRIITFEYTLVDGVNANPSHCESLVKLLRGLKCRVNLIPLNPTSHFGGRAPSREICEAFAEWLMRSGINTTLRRSKGGGVNASCGQLRANAKRPETREPGSLR